MIGFIGLLYVRLKVLQSLPDEIKDGNGIAADETANRLRLTFSKGKFPMVISLYVA